MIILINISGESVPHPSNKWADGEPNNDSGSQNCLAIQTQSGIYKYDDEFCSNRFPILCQFAIN